MSIVRWGPVQGERVVPAHHGPLARPPTHDEL